MRRHALGRVHREVLGVRGEIGFELRHKMALGAGSYNLSVCSWTLAYFEVVSGECQIAYPFAIRQKRSRSFTHDGIYLGQISSMYQIDVSNEPGGSNFEPDALYKQSNS